MHGGGSNPKVAVMSTGSWNLKRRFFLNPLGDLSGGLMAAVVALPLCLAFGVTSGLGAEAGLYGAIACGIFAALFGGTPGQCSGPTGPMTVVTAAMVAASPNRPELVFAAVVFAGIMQIVMGLAKAGRFISYMPYPVISGFMTGIGAIIVCIELGPLFGLPVTGSALAGLQGLVQLPKLWNLQAAIIGIGTLGLIFLLPKISKRLPASLIALISATWAASFFALDLPRIGAVPSLLPQPHLPVIGLSDMHLVVQSGLTLAMLGAIDSLLTSVVLDKVRGRRHDSDQELIGQGTGNIVAGIFGGIPGAGATMRSMVNVKSGGTTALSGVIHGLILLSVLIFCGPVASLVPLSSLAAILLVVGIGIMDWRVLRRLHLIPKSDVFVTLVVLALTIFVDLIVAVLVGIALASVLFVKRLTDMQSAAISDLDSMQNAPLASAEMPLLLRKNIYSYVLNGPLFFGEAKNLTAAVDDLAEAKYVILGFANVPLVDQTGAYALEDAIEKWEAKGIKVLFVGMDPTIRKTLEDTGAVHRIDMDNCFDEFEQAIDAIQRFETGITEEEPQEYGG